MTDWTTITDQDWSSLNDGQLATHLGCTRQNVSAARKRLKKPPSPEQRGGDRKSAAARDPKSPTTFVIDTTHAHKVRWLQAAREDGKKPDEWAAAMLDAACQT